MAEEENTTMMTHDRSWLLRRAFREAIDRSRVTRDTRYHRATPDGLVTIIVTRMDA